jgi:putative transposase
VRLTRGSKQLVQLAKDFGMGLRFEDLSGCLQTMKQKKKTKSDAANNRDTWAYKQLEQFTRYKAIRKGVLVESVPAPYTSKSDHRNGTLGVNCLIGWIYPPIRQPRLITSDLLR